MKEFCMVKRTSDMISDPLAWLLSMEAPSVRYFTMLNVLKKTLEDPNVQNARRAIMKTGPVPQILALQAPDGWWGSTEAATKPLYSSTAWQLFYLAELAADGSHPGIRRAAEIVWASVQSEQGDFPPQGSTFHKFVPEDMLCFDGMASWALLRLGYSIEDFPRAALAVEFLAGALLRGDLKCHFNGDAPCAWGGVKALRALALVPNSQRSPQVQEAIQRTCEYLLNGDLAHAAYPTRKGGKISDHWFRLGFPRSYQSDILQTLVTLTDLGYAGDSRMEPALDFLVSKRHPNGTWLLEETIAKMPIPFEAKGRPSRWITWQALYVLKAAGRPI
jgi:hypothetical protein